jgi:hypothetical protein
MTGQQAFDQMVTATTTTRVTFNNHISREDFEQWKQDFTFEALQGQRYGQSFCNRFGITDNLLYYTMWSAEQVDEYIETYYLERA